MVNFLNKALEIEDEIVNFRRDFHSHPELGYEEFRTSKIIKEFLDVQGIEYIETAKTGICAIIKGNGSKTIGIRADMDALPINEKNQVEYRSQNEGKMHACGHDAHTAILLGVAKILNKMKSELNGNVKLFFEPAEETTGGAKLMVSEGVLEDPYVDAVIGLHVDEKIEIGKIGIKSGVVNASSNPFKIKIFGRGGHGAHPDDTIDPVVISANIINAIQNIVSREISPTESAVITIGTIHGGTAQNIIPSEVTISGIIRTMKTENREYVKRRLCEVVNGITSAMRGRCEIEIEESYPCLYNDDKILNVIESASENVVGQENIIKLQSPSMGVESFAYFSMERPAAFYYLGSRNSNKDIVYPAHNELFNIDEKCLAIGTAIQCSAVYKFLNMVD